MYFVLRSKTEDLPYYNTAKTNQSHSLQRNPAPIWPGKGRFPVLSLPDLKSIAASHSSELSEKNFSKKRNDFMEPQSSF